MDLDGTIINDKFQDRLTQWFRISNVSQLTGLTFGKGGITTWF